MLLVVSLGAVATVDAQTTAPSAPAAAQVTLAQAVPQADAIALVRIGNPSTLQQREAGSGDPPYVRRRWRLGVVEVLKGQSLRVHSELLVDEAMWREERAAHKACAARKSSDACPLPSGRAYVSQLAREPRSGDTVLVLLRRDGAGWRLAWENAFDHASQADQAKRYLPPAKVKP
jgi:hypothetical protein